MKNNLVIPMLNLQLFAEGAGGTGAAAGDGGTAQGTGVTETAAGSQTGEISLADVKYGIQEGAPAAEVQTNTEAQPDLSAKFEALIKGEYKDQYNAKMQETVRKRLKGPLETVEKYNALQPILEILGKKHGVDTSDIEALTKAIQEDDSYFEAEALEMGLTVPQLKEIRKIERENADLKAQMAEKNKQEGANKIYAQWMQQAEDAQKMYPTFNFEAEMQNPEFVDLLRANVNVKTAYEVLHKDEIIAGAMQFTAKTVESKIAKKVAANGARPSENGMSSQSASLVKSDVSQLSDQDIDEVARRVARGERVTFG